MRIVPIVGFSVGLWAVVSSLYAWGVLAWVVSGLMLATLFVLMWRIMDAPTPDVQMGHDMRCATGVGAALVVMIAVFL